MTHFGPYALFLVTAVAHLLITAYAIIRSRQRAALSTEEKDNFSTMMPTTPSTLVTPESIALDPRAQQYPGDDGDYVEKGAGI
ncbi:hypothetical protein D3C86_1896610 [compost metagenome]